MVFSERKRRKNKPDSQDFYAGHYGDLLDATDKDGVFVDVDGRVLGRHKGFWHYTVGQRKGLGIAAKKPLYVLRLNAERNEVVLAEKEAVLTRDAVAENCVWSAIDGLTEERRVTAKLRSTQTPAAAVAFPLNGGRIGIQFDELQKPAAPGQSVVLYDGDTVLGGGVLTVK